MPKHLLISLNISLPSAADQMQARESSPVRDRRSTTELHHWCDWHWWKQRLLDLTWTTSPYLHRHSWFPVRHVTGEWPKSLGRQQRRPTIRPKSAHPVSSVLAFSAAPWRAHLIDGTKDNSCTHRETNSTHDDGLNAFRIRWPGPAWPRCRIRSINIRFLSPLSLSCILLDVTSGAKHLRSYFRSSNKLRRLLSYIFLALDL